MNSHRAAPDDFFAAAECAIALLKAGAPPPMLSVMARGMSRRGKADAAMGFDHVRLRVMASATKEDSSA